MNNWIIPHGRRLLSALSKKFPDEQGILHKHWEDLLLLFVSTPEKDWKQQLKEFHFSKELCDALVKAHLVQRARLLSQSVRAYSATYGKGYVYGGSAPINVIPTILYRTLQPH